MNTNDKSSKQIFVSRISIYTGDTFKITAFKYNACGPFTKNEEKTKNNKGTGDSRYIYQNLLDKACFQHNLAHGNFKDLNRRITAYKVLHDKRFNIAQNPKYDGYQRGLVSMIYKFFYKNLLIVTLKVKYS